MIHQHHREPLRTPALTVDTPNMTLALIPPVFPVSMGLGTSQTTRPLASSERRLDPTTALHTSTQPAATLEGNSTLTFQKIPLLIEVKLPPQKVYLLSQI